MKDFYCKFVVLLSCLLVVFVCACTQASENQNQDLPSLSSQLESQPTSQPYPEATQSDPIENPDKPVPGESLRLPTQRDLQLHKIR